MWGLYCRPIRTRTSLLPEGERGYSRKRVRKKKEKKPVSDRPVLSPPLCLSPPSHGHKRKRHDWGEKGREKGQRGTLKYHTHTRLLEAVVTTLGGTSSGSQAPREGEKERKIHAL